jgi:hypothetical protein
MKRAGFAASALVAAGISVVAIDASVAQQNAPVRIRGTITRIAGDQLTVRSLDGKILHIILARDARIAMVVPAKLSDIKPGRFVGTAARPDGDKWRALEVHIFPVGSRLGEGHRPWSPEPGATMTNADVTAAVIHARSGELTLSTGGQSFTVEVPKGTPVVAMNPGTRAQVMPGAHVAFNAVTTESDGRLSASSITITKDPRYPPE